MTPLAKPSLAFLLCLTLAACTRPGDDRAPEDRSAAENWKRDERSFVYLSERRARYAGITRTAEGRLLILFTHQTAQQERDGSGELHLVRRTRDGDWWFYPEPVFEGRQGEPRAMGTLTTLESGRIIAPFAELNDRSAGSRLRLLSSDDHGETWAASAPLNTQPLIWAAPYGRPFELGNRVMMPVYGAASQQDLAATRLRSGLLQSRDGGKTWSDWIPIAVPDPKADVSYEFPAVLPLEGGTWLSVMTERRLKKRPELPLDIPQMLVRSYSSDQGQSWTEPEPLCVGSWASLTPMGSGTVACSFALWSAWGSMEVMFSNDGFRTIRHRSPFVEHNWLPGYGPSGWGKGWARDPIPLPPVVPNLEGDWQAGHYGFSSGLALDDDRLMLVVGQRQKGSGYTDPPHEVNLPIEAERIEAIVMKRVEETSAPAAEPLQAHGEPDGQWYLAERWPEEEWRQKVGQPPNDVTLVLKSGRWIRLTAQYTVPHRPGPGRILGRERGYWVWKSVDGLHYQTRLQGSYSDDRGETWIPSAIDEPVPLAAAVHLGGVAFEEPDGTLVAPIYGYLNHGDMSVSLYVSALVRSHDGGESWGDWSIIAYDRQNRYTAYSETQVMALSDQTWVAFLRSENRSYVPVMRAFISRALSRDRGRTWSPPQPTAAAGVTAGLRLPDGGIALSAQNTCGWGLAVSYNYGHTWNYVLPATYFSARAGVLDDKSFWLHDAHGGIVSIYRRK